MPASVTSWRCVAIRPGGMGGKYSVHPGGYENAAALVAGLKKIGPFQISVAGYPEKHPDSADAKADLENLKRKVDAGADRCITQFFFEADDFLRFRDSAAAAGIHVPVVPGVMPVSNFQGITKMAGLCGSKVPAWLANLFDGLDDDVETRRLIAATVAGDLCRRLQSEGVEQFHLLYAEPCGSHLRDLPSAGSTSAMTREKKAEQLREIGSERILIKDGPCGSMIQSYRLDEAGYRGGPQFKDTLGNHDQKGNNDLLNLTRPDVISEICNAYLDAGRRYRGDQHLQCQLDQPLGLAASAAWRARSISRPPSLTRACADAATARDPAKPRFVAGALGPTNKTLSVSPNVNDPGYRAVTFDEVKDMYREQIDGLLDGGVDFILIETMLRHAERQGGRRSPIERLFEARGDPRAGDDLHAPSTDLAGRTLSGQTAEAFWNSVRHAQPFSIGLNCALGAERDARPYRRL